MTLIVDAGPLVALGDASERRHGVVREVLEREVGRLIIPAAITAEVDYLVRQRGGPGAGRRFLEDLAAGRFEVQSLTVEEHNVALWYHDQYSALDLGLSDLSVIVLAHRYHTDRLLTFDERDFRSVTPVRGGAFVLLPADM